MNAYTGAAAMLAGTIKANKTTQANKTTFATLQTQQKAVVDAENVAVQDILANACKALNAGCFAAGTKLWTPDGFRKVEDILAGELVYARNEYDVNGDVETRLVEEKFSRTGRILHVHANGQVIRTTPEHPFHEAYKGWVAADALQNGDTIRTDGGWVTVEEVFDGVAQKGPGYLSVTPSGQSRINRKPNS